MWQKCGRPSWCLLAIWRNRGPFSVKRCSQNSQLNGRSPVCVRWCLSRLAAHTIRKHLVNNTKVIEKMHGFRFKNELEI